MKSVHLGKPKPMWLSHKALKAVKHRHRVHRKYRDSGHPACKKADRLASAAVKKSRWHFEHNLKNDRKSFYAYARSKTKSMV